MLKTVAVSGNSKTGAIAVTYRAGAHHVYSTCPKTCALHPKSESGSSRIDKAYLRAVFDAVPRGGQAWTYSHFPAEALPRPETGKTVFNASCDNVRDAIEAAARGRPAVYAAPLGTQWPQKIHGVRFIRCPAELSENFTCRDCGNGRPLCARGERDYVIVFVAHGNGKKRVGSETGGGCYAASGHAAIAWRGAHKTGAPDDAAALRAFARSLPPGSLLRHHVAGDVGAG